MALSRRPSLSDDRHTMKIYEEIGSGSFGKVYRAFDSRLQRVVAVKMIQLDTSRDMSEFLLELQFLRELKCKNITEVISSSLEDSVLWVSMEYCGAGSCSHILHRYKVFSEPAALYVIHEALLGLAYIHEQRKIHRDLKSANILVTEHGDVKIADFGVSAQLSDQIPLRTTFMGTPYWMAPEVIIGDRYGTAVDIWSLGIVAYELITGTPPLRDFKPDEVIRMIESGPPPQLPATTGTNATISVGFRRFVSSCLRKQPRERPSAEELLRSSVFKLGGSVFSSQGREMRRPPEFTRMVKMTVRQRKTTSLQNPVRTRTAADIEDLAPQKTLHSRDEWVNSDISPAPSSKEDSDWDFTEHKGSFEGMALSSPSTDGPSPSSDAPIPDHRSPALGRSGLQPIPRVLPAAVSPYRFWSRLKHEQLDIDSPPPPPVPIRNKRHLRHSLIADAPRSPLSPLDQGRARASSCAATGTLSPVPSPLNAQQHQKKRPVSMKVGIHPKAPLPSPPKPALSTSRPFEEIIRPALLETERRARWAQPIKRTKELTQTLEQLDMELPGFTQAFVEELHVRFAKRKAAKSQ